MAAAISGVPLRGPDRIRPIVVAVIGVLLGARFTPEILGQLGAWAGSLSLLVVYLAVVAALVVPFYHFIGRQDWTTSYFAGMPGGLTEMIEMGEARGADVRVIIFAHSLRIVITIALIAFWFRVVLGHQVGSGTGLGPQALSWGEAGLLLAAAFFGSLLGKALRFPAPTFLGPMLVSGLLHVSGVSEALPPSWLVNGAQVVMGTVLGARFLGVQLRALRHAAALSLGSTMLTLAVALIFAWIEKSLMGIDPAQSLLALAPGGLTEMGLIALAIHADVAFVALHHVVRILLILTGAPLLFALFDRRRR